jgi:NADP-dependent 3-hydroxy acid dehydrogenase YdfG
LREEPTIVTGAGSGIDAALCRALVAAYPQMIKQAHGRVVSYDCPALRR